MSESVREERLATCASCVHWNAMYASARTHPDTWNKKDCRKHAPIAHEAYDRSIDTVWPQTASNDWCGDWTQIEPNADLATQ